MIKEFDESDAPSHLNANEAVFWAQGANSALSYAQAATEATDAKWQARVKELEEALMEVTLLSARNHAAWVNAEQLLVNTSPDQALQRALLEARIDELKFLDESRNYKITPEQDVANRIAALRAKRNEIGG